jgi:hypothetical protein
MSAQLIEALGGMGGLAQMAKELGIDEKTVAAGAAALAPAVLGGFKQQAASGGLDGLVGMLGGMGGGGLLDAVLSPQATPVNQGNEVLGQIFGTPDVSRAVAGQASANTGIPVELLKKMLPMVAMAAAGFMAKSANAAPAEGGGGLGGLLGQVAGMLGGGQPAAAGGMAGLASMLDLDGDGNPLDDMLGMAQKMTR